MTAEVKAENVQEGGDLNLALSHAMALVEFNIPTYAYKTSDEADAYTYGVPLGDLTITLGGTDYTPYNISTGLYRCIVSPSDAAFDINGSFMDVKVNKPVKLKSRSDNDCQSVQTVQCDLWRCSGYRGN